MTYANALFANPTAGAAWITLRLVGKKASRFAVGGRIEVVPRMAASPLSALAGTLRLRGPGGPLGCLKRWSTPPDLPASGYAAVRRIRGSSAGGGIGRRLGVRSCASASTEAGADGSSLGFPFRRRMKRRLPTSEDRPSATTQASRIPDVRQARPT